MFCRKVVFWGASIFLEEFLKRWNIKSNNILAIIDKNPYRTGQTLGDYKILLPECLNELNPDFIIMTIKNRHKEIYKELQSTIKSKYNNTSLLSDIFEL